MDLLILIAKFLLGVRGTKDLGVHTHHVNEKKRPDLEQPPPDPLSAANMMWANSQSSANDTSSHWGTVELHDLPSATYTSGGQEGVQIVQTKVDFVSFNWIRLLKQLCFTGPEFIWWTIY